jgi:hypothetical protein
MIPYSERLPLAFKAFFSILFRGELPTPSQPTQPQPTPPTMATPDAARDSSKRADGTAAQMLAVLQRDGRLVDFLMEDLSSYPDAQVGAAVRDVHAGCRRALQRYVSLAPVLDSEEGQSVTVEAGTDAATVKLLGNVTGQSPFRGVLRHRGWRVERFDLPTIPTAGGSIVAPAEVELS